MSIEIIGDTKVITDIKKELVENIEDVLKEYGELAAKEIQVRSQSGKNWDDKPFPKYSDSYREYKTEVLGRSGKVDLTLTGNMLRAITSRVFKQGTNYILEIFFNDTSSRAPRSNKSVTAKEKALSVSEKFPFMRLNERQLQKLKTLIIKEL